MWCKYLDSYVYCNLYPHSCTLQESCITYYYIDQQCTFAVGMYKVPFSSITVDSLSLIAIWEKVTTKAGVCGKATISGMSICGCGICYCR